MEFEELTGVLLGVLKYPIVIVLLSTVLGIVKAVTQGMYLGDLNEEIKKREEELTKEEEPQKINIDKDLQKYFNYKE